jgi:hypothetical protein
MPSATSGGCPSSTRSVYASFARLAAEASNVDNPTLATEHSTITSTHMIRTNLLDIAVLPNQLPE